MSHEPRPTSQEEISQWIQKAAAARAERPDDRPGSALLAEASDFHAESIERALRRARQKTFVRMMKPLRNLFRNQGAVNESLIEAVEHLAAQNQEAIEELGELQAQVAVLRKQLRRTSGLVEAESRANEAQQPHAPSSDGSGPCA